MRLKFTIILPLTCLFLASAINSLPIKSASTSTNSLVLPVPANPAAPGNRKNSPLRSVTLPPASAETETLIPTPKAEEENRKANPIGSWAKKVFHRLKPQAGSTKILPDRPLEEYPLKTLNKRIETLIGELEAERKSPFGNLYTEEKWVKKILELFDAEKRKVYLETKAPPTPTFQRHLEETVDLLKAAMKSARAEGIQKELANLLIFFEKHIIPPHDRALAMVQNQSRPKRNGRPNRRKSLTGVPT